MLLFVTIALAAFLIVAGSFLFGHDHDLGHDQDLSHDAEAAGSEPTVSIFSIKVIGTLLMGFGAAGAIARFYGANVLGASLIGLGSGLVLGAIMYALLNLFYSQQASSLVATDDILGRSGTVTVSISEGGVGEVGLNIAGQYMTRLAASSDGQAIARGQAVRVVRTVGSQLIVDKET